MPNPSDDNPFARNSPWPRMPSSPFRVGPLPKASVAEPAPTDVSPSEPQIQAITPAFTRPITSAPPPSPKVPATQPAVQRSPVADPPDPAVVVELTPLIVRPPERAVRARRSRLPAIATGLVGFAGLMSLIFVFNREEQTPTASAPTVASVPAPASGPVAAEAPTVAEAPQLRPAAGAVEPTRMASAPPPVNRHPRSGRTPARSVAKPVETPPVIQLPDPPAAPAAAEPVAPVAPVFIPPPAPDPSAPMTTGRPE